MKFAARRRKDRKRTQTKEKRGGSLPAKRRSRFRNRQLYHKLPMQDYFVDNPTYDNCQFRRRFRMCRQLFDRIMHDVVSHDSYFDNGVDACGEKSFSSRQKIAFALGYMAYGGCTDRLDETLRFAESILLLK